MKISTKIGDKGETELLSGKKISKGSDIIEFLGSLDELQSFLGWCRFVIGIENGDEVCKVLDRIQDDLFRMMSIVGAEMECPKGVKEISEKDVEFLENEIEKYEKFVGDREEFVKPGTTEAGSRFHIARTVCRRVERAGVRCFEGIGGRGKQKSSKTGKSEFSSFFLKYLNRLSDLLFVLACKFEA